MSQSVHGHEVLNFMLENKAGFTKESLISGIQTKFGADTLFHTCSAEGMNAEQLVDFLAEKGKFVENGAGFNTEREKICNH